MTRKQQKLLSIHRRPPDIHGDYPARGLEPTPERPLIVSASELATFLRCRVKWNWRHQVRLEPKTRPVALAFGDLIHQGLERWYGLPSAKRSRKAMEKLAPKLCRTINVKDLSSEDRELAEAMLIGYAAWAKIEDAEIGLRDCLPEREFDLPLDEAGCIRVRGRIDTQFTPRKREVACKEFKTRSQFRDDNVEMLLQASVYLWALRQLVPKQRVYTLHYTELRKQLPGPRVTAPLFQSQPIERTNDEIAQWAIDTARIALDMMDPAIYPNPMSNCQFDCDFRNPCVLRGNRSDLEHVLSTEYQIKESR